MGYVQLQERSSSCFSVEKRFNSRSLAVICVVAFAHVIVIILAMNMKAKQRELRPEGAINLATVLKKPEGLFLEPKKPLIYIRPPQPIYYPRIQIAEPALLVGEPVDFTSQLPSQASKQYTDVFDPKLRKKLQDLPVRKKTEPKIKRLGVGVTLEYIGDGICIFGDSVNKTGRKVKCGADSGEQMLMNVERALADPLGLK